MSFEWDWRTKSVVRRICILLGFDWPRGVSQIQQDRLRDELLGLWADGREEGLRECRERGHNDPDS